MSTLANVYRIMDYPSIHVTSSLHALLSVCGMLLIIQIHVAFMISTLHSACTEYAFHIHTHMHVCTQVHALIVYLIHLVLRKRKQNRDHNNNYLPCMPLGDNNSHTAQLLASCHNSLLYTATIQSLAL